MKNNIYLLSRITIFFIVLLGVLYILEYGFVFDSPHKLLNVFLLAGLTTIIFFNLRLRRYALILAIVCLAIMVLTYILYMPYMFLPTGDFGFSLLIITIVSYLPKIIKKGYIERF